MTGLPPSFGELSVELTVGVAVCVTGGVAANAEYQWLSPIRQIY